MPVPWTKDQDTSKIEKKLFAFLKDSAWQAEISGDINEANQLMKELKETDLNKRDSKALYKNLQKASTSEEMTKEMI